MKTLLRIDTSSRTNGSHSRKLADYIEIQWKSSNPKGNVIVRDLAVYDIPHIQNNTIVGFYTPEEKLTDVLKKALEVSNELIEEILKADELLISSPLYNLNIPSNLKAYFDQVVRINKTFAIDRDGNYYGMLKNKKAYLSLVKGGTYKGTPMEALDFQPPYLKAILNHMGITDVEIFSLESTSDIEKVERNLSEIKTQIHEKFTS